MFTSGQTLREKTTGGPFHLLERLPHGYWRCKDLNSGTIFDLEDARVNASELVMTEKLIRDKIPDIILNHDGSVPTLRVATQDSDYNRLLIEKLQEEVREFVAKPSLEELADIQEVIYALCDVQSANERQRLEEVRAVKAFEKGTFSKRYVLVG